MSSNACSPARRAWLGSAAALAAGAALPARSQSDASSPIRVIVGLPPGGAADVIARTIAAAHEKAIGRPVIIENRPGGQFQISMQTLASAPADGRTLLYLYNGYASVHAVQKLFDLQRQVTPVAQVASTPIVLLVRGDSPYQSLGDLIAYGRANAGKLSYGTLGAGGVEHLKIEQICRAAGLRAVAVPYKGGVDMAKAVIGGETDFCLNAAIFARQFGPTGQLRALAILESARWSDLPAVPTLAEAGVDVPPLTYWGGYVVRAGTPSEVVARLHRELSAAASTPAVAEKLAGAGGRVLLSESPEAFRRVIDSDIEWMGTTARQLNLTG